MRLRRPKLTAALVLALVFLILAALGLVLGRLIAGLDWTSALFGS